jgi:N-acetyl sugar amidotransferase
MNNTNYQQCTKTVMDNIADPNITFDENGVCNYYYEYFEEYKRRKVSSGEEGRKLLEDKIKEIKQNSKEKPYDCILGISGGVDSTYMAYLAKQYDLRVLLVHFDNGWDSELAVKNIENIVTKTGFDLYSLVVDWDEFKQLQIAYFKASVIDLEMPTDHAIIGTLYKLAAKHNVKYFLNGYNVVTEAILPKAWNYNKLDATNMKDIYRNHGSGKKIVTYPFFDTYEKKKYVTLGGIENVLFLNYIDYNKSEVKKIITEKLDWKDYGGKHYESIFTRFYQGYILPTKFGIDKRKAHLSTLICSGQITKEEALAELEKPIYNHEQYLIDREFVLKKLDFTEAYFEELMKLPIRSHFDFKTGKNSIYDIYPLLKPLKPLVDLILKK